MLDLVQLLIQCTNIILFQNPKMAYAYANLLDLDDPDYDRIIPLEEFEDQLKCQVCRLVPRVTPVWQCLNSHLTCKACYT